MPQSGVFARTLRGNGDLGTPKNTFFLKEVEGRAVVHEKVICGDFGSGEAPFWS